MYKTFTRTWWRNNPDWPDGLEPEAGRRYTHHKDIETEEEARTICQQYNNTHNPGRLSKKMEYEEQ